MTFPVDELKELFAGHEYPIIVGMHFVRDSKRSFDINNANQIIFDLLTAFDVIEDDNADCVIPQVLWINGKHYSIDKINPGCYVSIIERQ